MRKFILICGAICASSFSVQAQENPIALGKYKSLNGEIEHYFSDSGDYTGIVHSGEPKTYKGVYRFSPGLCWLSGPNGSKGFLGNVLIHYEEEQCCLLFEDISDKVAVTYVWTKPYEFLGAHGICSSQVLKKQ